MLITCPNCGRQVQPQSRNCDNCGVDLAIAAVIAEQSFTISPDLQRGAPIAPESLVPRIGEYLIDLGLLQTIDLQRALNFQKERLKAGKPILLGEAFLELGLIKKEHLDQAIATQILKLQKALADANQNLQQRVQERTQELQNALERLAELNQLKSNFIATISHELRTPLTHLKGYLELLNDQSLGPLNSGQVDAIGVMMRAENRLERLIEDLIQFSMASRGELSLNLDQLNLRSLINSSVDQAHYKAGLKQVSISTNMPAKLPDVRVDEEKMSWVLLQLLDNAIKFTPQGGRIVIKANHTDHKVVVAIIDSGIGIPKERIQEIFEPFHQLDGSSTRRYGGTGLGLAMVKKIVEAHGSTITVESVSGKGTKFEFYLSSV